MLWHVLIYRAEDSHFSCDLTDGTDGACCGKYRASRYPAREKGRIRRIFRLALADEAEEKSYAVSKLREQNVR